ncbi:hypothetical protein [Candidatus Magnetaquicoccus inordinatus]|uniref:hypothetical protein n=1 Tax=Candidatus Magnetaquicoccus inordinatus TaxID=2496818 RepID=UPI00187D2925|nr:hypothetical protein [Candidatus Magnetaquicoccus inordinatus]
MSDDKQMDGNLLASWQESQKKWSGLHFFLKKRSLYTDKLNREFLFIEIMWQ